MKKSKRVKSYPYKAYLMLGIFLSLPIAITIFMGRHGPPEEVRNAVILVAVLAQLPLLILLFPAAWWTVSPPKQPDTLIGKWLGRLIQTSLRNLAWRAYQALFLAALFAGFGLLLLWAMLALLGVFLLVVLKGPPDKKPRRDTPKLPFAGALLIALGAWLFAVCFLAPFRAALLAYFFLAGHRSEFMGFLSAGESGARIDLYWGPAAALVAVVLVGLDAFWRLEQARQLDNLPTSKARSASVGLVELQGVARSLSGANWPLLELKSSMNSETTSRLSPFYLEDASGRILVNPKGCRIRRGGLADFTSLFRVHEVVLTGRVKTQDEDEIFTRTLKDGDPVYVLGNAEINEHAPADAVDSERLVVRPSAAPSLGRALWAAFFGAAPLPAGRDYYNIFFIADGTQRLAKKHILRGLLVVWAVGAAWVGVSGWLYWSAQHRLAHYGTRVISRPIPKGVHQTHLYQLKEK